MKRTISFFSRDAHDKPLHSEVYGSGEKILVFVADLSSTTHYWRARSQPLDARYRVMLVVLAGFRQSLKPWTQYSAERHANELRTVLACVVTRRTLGWLLPYVVRRVPQEVAEDLVKHTWRSSTSSWQEVVYRYNSAVDHQPFLGDPPSCRALIDSMVHCNRSVDRLNL